MTLLWEHVCRNSETIAVARAVGAGRAKMVTRDRLDPQWRPRARRRRRWRGPGRWRRRRAALARRRETRAAQEWLERALALALRESVRLPAYDRAGVQFALARALVAAGGDRQRARELAIAARDGLAGQGDKWQRDIAEIEAWLAGRRETARKRPG